jgi:hypothetical protein
MRNWSRRKGRLLDWMSSLYFDVLCDHGCVPIRLPSIVIPVRCPRVSTTALLIISYDRHAAFSAPPNGPCRNYIRHGNKPSTGGTNYGISAPIKGVSFEGTTAHDVHIV